MKKSSAYSSASHLAVLPVLAHDGGNRFSGATSEVSGSGRRATAEHDLDDR